MTLGLPLDVLTGTPDLCSLNDVSNKKCPLEQYTILHYQGKISFKGVIKSLVCLLLNIIISPQKITSFVPDHIQSTTEHVLSLFTGICSINHLLGSVVHMSLGHVVHTVDWDL